MAEPCLACAFRPDGPNTITYVHCRECHKQQLVPGRYTVRRCPCGSKQVTVTHYRRPEG